MTPVTMRSPWPLQHGSCPQYYCITLAVLSTLTFLVISTYLIRRNPKRRKPRLPPSPRRLPFIGHIHLLTPNVHRSFLALSQKHGPLMLLYLGKQPTVVVSSAEAAREVMGAQDLVFASRLTSRTIDKITYGSKNISFSPYGEHWRQARKAAVIHLLGTKRVQSFRQLREEEVALMVEKVKASSSPASSVLDMSEVLQSLTEGLINRVVVGSSLEGERHEIFRQMLDEIGELTEKFELEDFFPSAAGWLRMLPFTDSKLRKLLKRWDGFHNQILEEREQQRRGQQGEEGSKRDFLDILLSMHRDPTTGFPTSRNIVKAMWSVSTSTPPPPAPSTAPLLLITCSLSYFGELKISNQRYCWLPSQFKEMVEVGSVSTLATLEWAMAELVKNPGAMDRAQSEVREVTGRKSLATEDDIIHMSYLKAVIKEALRLHPPLPLLIPRESMEDTQLHGYDIPIQTTILINAWAIARDPSHWEDPEEFRPERFLDSHIDFKGNHFQYIPFGAGRRICPGINFSTCEVELALANLLHRFDWDLPNGMRVEDLGMDEAPGFFAPRNLKLRLVAIPYCTQR